MFDEYPTIHIDSQVIQCINAASKAAGGEYESMLKSNYWNSQRATWDVQRVKKVVREDLRNTTDQALIEISICPQITVYLL